MALGVVARRARRRADDLRPARPARPAPEGASRPGAADPPPDHHREAAGRAQLHRLAGLYDRLFHPASAAREATEPVARPLAAPAEVDRRTDLHPDQATLAAAARDVRLLVGARRIEPSERRERRRRWWFGSASSGRGRSRAAIWPRSRATRRPRSWPSATWWRSGRGWRLGGSAPAAGSSPTTGPCSTRYQWTASSS